MTDATKESLIKRVEALFDKGIDGIESALHDAIEVVENLFTDAQDDDATLDITTGEPAAVTPADGSDAESASTGEVAAS